MRANWAVGFVTARETSRSTECFQKEKEKFIRPRGGTEDANERCRANDGRFDGLQARRA
jgi:hypothetical protein